MTAPAVASSCRILPDDWLGPLPLERWFERGRPLDVDVGCGKGRFLLARAAAHPERNLLGVDRMLRRVRKVDRRVARRGLANVRLLRMEAYYAVAHLLPPDAVSTYFIFFPDPWPKKRHHEHRLFNARFMDAVQRTLVAGGTLHFATDHRPYFEEVAGLLRQDARFEEAAPYVPPPAEQTDFELWYGPRVEIGRCAVKKR